MHVCLHLGSETLGVGSACPELSRFGAAPDLIPLGVEGKSLMVKQMVHLKTFRSLGHLTKDAHVMQLPVAKSLAAGGPPRL
jgi:hypothetical protein